MIRQGYYSLLVALTMLAGCSERMASNLPVMSDRAIVLSSDVRDAEQSRVVVENNTALSAIQFLRKDGTTAPSSFSGAAVVTGNRSTTGDITFTTPTVPTYKLNNDNSYLRAYYPAGAVASNKVTWPVDAKTDILLSSTFDAGNFLAPISGPMVLSHVLAQLEITCVADPSTTVPDALTQAMYGSVTKIELIGTYNSVSFDYGTGVVSGSGAIGSVPFIGSDYKTAFAATPLTKSGFTVAGMFVAASSGTTPIKLRITTEKGGQQQVEVALKGSSATKGFAAGLKHTVNLQFTKYGIVVLSTSIGAWTEKSGSGIISDKVSNQFTLQLLESKNSGYDYTTVKGVRFTANGVQYDFSGITFQAKSNILIASTAPFSFTTTHPNLYPYTIEKIELLDASNKPIINGNFSPNIMVSRPGLITMMYTPTDYFASPIPGYPNTYVAKTNNTVANWQTATNNCAAWGGRLPNSNELIAIYKNKASYGTFSDRSSYYWSSTAFSSGLYYVVSLVDGDVTNNGIGAERSVRCVKEI